MRGLSSSMSGVVGRKITAGTSKLDIGIGIGRTRVVLARMSGNLGLSGVLLYRLYNLPLRASFRLTSRDVGSLPLPGACARTGMDATLDGHRRLGDLRLTSRVCHRGMGMIHTSFLPSMTLATGCLIAGPSLIGKFRGGFHNV